MLLVKTLPRGEIMAMAEAVARAYGLSPKNAEKVLLDCVTSELTGNDSFLEESKIASWLHKEGKVNLGNLIKPLVVFIGGLSASITEEFLLDVKENFDDQGPFDEVTAFIHHSFIEMKFIRNETTVTAEAENISPEEASTLITQYIKSTLSEYIREDVRKGIARLPVPDILIDPITGEVPEMGKVLLERCKSLSESKTFEQFCRRVAFKALEDLSVLVPVYLQDEEGAKEAEEHAGSIWRNFNRAVRSWGYIVLRR